MTDMMVCDESFCVWHSAFSFFFFFIFDNTSDISLIAMHNGLFCWRPSIAHTYECWVVTLWLVSDGSNLEIKMLTTSLLSESVIRYNIIFQCHEIVRFVLSWGWDIKCSLIDPHFSIGMWVAPWCSCVRRWVLNSMSDRSAMCVDRKKFRLGRDPKIYVQLACLVRI